MTPYQKNFYITWQIAPDSPVHNESIIFRLKQNPDIDKLRKALMSCIDKHFVLKMYVDSIEQALRPGMFIIDDYFTIFFKQERGARAQLKKLIEQPFNLYKGPCIRFQLIKYDRECYFIICCHHLICDAISAQIIVRDISAAYDQPILEKNVCDLMTTNNKTSYANSALQYWTNYLKDCSLHTHLQKSQFIGKNTISDWFDTSIKKNIINTIAKKYKTTEFIVLVACYGFLLSRCLQKEKLILSYPISIRDKATSNKIGCYVNTIPLKIDLANIETFSQLIFKLNCERRESKKYWNVPTVDMLSNINLGTQVNKHINIGIAQTNLNSKSFTLGDIQATGIDIVPKKYTNYDLVLLYDEYKQDAIKLRSVFNCDYFDKNFVKTFTKQLVLLLNSLNVNDISLTGYSLMSAAQYQQIVNQFSLGNSKQYSVKSVAALLNQQINAAPENMAVITNDTHYTYQTLAEHITSIHNLLRNHKNQVIAVYMPQGLLFYLSFLAINNSNAIYMPLDVRSSPEKVLSILNKAACKVILTSEEYANSLALDDSFTIIILSKNINKPAATDKSSEPGSSDLAYVLFTSGTTGQPKGVMVTHQALSNRIEWMQNEFHLGVDDVVLHKTNPCFDVSLWEMLWPVCYGAKVAIADQEICSDYGKLYQFIFQTKVTILHFVPTLLVSFLDYLIESEVKIPKSVRLIICSGEVLHKEQVNKAYRYAEHTNFALYNLYGPTEACIDVTYFHCRPNQAVFIGRPIDNTEIYILNENMQPLPIGIKGEIYIGGKNLAKGYINEDFLTKKYFVQHPFKDGKKLYKSGDHAIWQDDGTLAFMGRNDDEIKFNGQRLNLHDMEYVVSNSASIQLCSVVYNTPHIVIYYSTRSGKELTEKAMVALNNGIAQSLLGHIPPIHWQHVSQFPINCSGKIDKNALAKLKNNKLKILTLAKTPTEHRLTKIWQKVLNMEHIDINADFIALAIDSLQAIELLSSVNRQFALTLHAADLYKLQTIKAIAKYIQKNKISKHLVKDLSGSKKLPVIFFIHPAKGGCEVYQYIASKLKKDYKCYGIDNYNLYCNERHAMSSLSSLASHYILQIKQYHILEEKSICLCGWSLGGNIALEIAYQLEKQGVKNIQVILFDSYIVDSQIEQLRLEIANDYSLEKYKQQLVNQNVRNTWQEKLLKVYPIEQVLERQKVSGKLVNSKVFLFKAEQLIPMNINSVQERSINQYIIDLPLNNIDKYVPENNITRISVNCHHDNILDSISMLVSFKVFQATLRKYACNDG